MSGCSAALLRGGAVAAARSLPMRHGHAEALIPMVQAVLAEARAAFAGLDAVAVTVGPGSFTGVRVGLAAVRGLALAHDLPVVGLTTLEVVAFGVPCDAAVAADDPVTIVAAIETRRDDVYVQCFTAGLYPLSAPAALALGDIDALAPAGPLVVVGDAAGRTADALRGRRGDIRRFDAPAADAVLLVRLARERIARDGLPDRADLPGPLYVHPPRATIPPNEGRLRP